MLVLDTGYSFWNPLIWLVALVVVGLVALFLRSRGQKNYKKGTAQAEIFLCGEEAPAAGKRHVRASNAYWGFFEALKEYYDGVIKPHTGIINDYIVWFIAVMALCAVVLAIVGWF